MRHRDLLDAIGHTPLVELTEWGAPAGVRLYAKLEGTNPTGSIKDRIALHMLRRARESGELRPGQTIVEASTGNAAISLAMIGRQLGHPFVAVMPDLVGREVRQLLGVYGAEIVYTGGLKGAKGAIDAAQALARERGFYMPFQFANPRNPECHYQTTAIELLTALPHIDVLVAGLGTGGTVVGIGRRLRERDPQLQVIAVEPHPGELVQGLRSLKDGYIPPVFDEGVLNGKFVVHGTDAAHCARELTRREGIFAGVSAGAVMHAALRVARRLENATVVAILADGGWKYLSLDIWGATDDEKRQRWDKIWW
jgi:cysteine synthase B